jgi:hypothetical protein
LARLRAWRCASIASNSASVALSIRLSIAEPVPTSKPLSAWAPICRPIEIRARSRIRVAWAAPSASAVCAFPNATWRLNLPAR